MLSLIIASAIITFVHGTVTLQNATGVKCRFTSTDFYYRAISATYLGVLYSTMDESNILTEERLQAIQDIELDIRSWPGYLNHSTIYRESTQEITAAFGESRVYCQATPISPLAYIFPELVTIPGFGSSYIYNGYGQYVTPDWRSILWSDYLDSYFDIYFDPDTFIPKYEYESSYLVAIYPFGYIGADETKADLYEWVQTYDELLSTANTQQSDIMISWMIYNDSIPNTITINDVSYDRDITPAPTYAPTVSNYTGTITPSPSNCYQFGYSFSTGSSDGQIVAVDANRRRILDSDTGTPTPTMEVCRETYWPRYEVADDASDVIYYEDYRWNLMNGDDEYYCNVLLEDVSLCDGQWKDLNGTFVDLEIVYDVDSSSILRTLGLIVYIVGVCWV